jgi:mannobiose 2-epimerase
MTQSYSARIERELTGNILPFWIKYTVDHANGGFYGAVSNDLRVLNDVERSLVLCARILWTYAAAYRANPRPEYLEMAQHAYAYLTTRFYDEQHGGFYWTLDQHGAPINDRKQSYGQGFAIYGLTEYYLACGAPQALALAQETFKLLEQHAFDPAFGGYLESRSREWGVQSDMRLSDKEPNAAKSMNTMLHILEPYTNLVRAWPDAWPRRQLAGLLRVFLDHIVDPDTHATRLFYEPDWTVQGDHISYGHDIECAWLIWEAAEVLNDPALGAPLDAALTERARLTSIAMAAAVAAQAVEPDGSLLYEASPRGIEIDDKHWWAQAEGMVGFYNAAQLLQASHPAAAERFRGLALRLWDYIEEHHVDRQHGEWLKRLYRDGTPHPVSYKTGPWDCPYHHTRACLEMLRRLEE